jgi:hypothetical protein
MDFDIKPADMSKIRRNSIKNRENLVKASEFCKVALGSGIREFMESLPSIKHRTNAATSLVTVIERIQAARTAKALVTWAIGPHVIKYGLSPLIIDLMDRGAVQCILFNGATAIHDVEIALAGETSEEMGGHISTGEFGMGEETGDFINQAAVQAARAGAGFGLALGEKILAQNPQFASVSILAQAAKRHIPVTVHVAIGTDIIHMHPDMDGAATGEATHTDFKIFVSVLRQFSGGVHLNIGSTVVLPEVFVKALTSANNLNQHPAERFTTVHIDHLSEYRPLMNVVRRGSMDGGEGYEIIGRMEILVPLLAWMIRETLPPGIS